MIVGGAMIVSRSISEPIINPSDWDKRWGSREAGLITSWNRGREMAIEYPVLANNARDGQLISLPWKGGVEQKIQKNIKYGSMFYLAMWQGLRGEDLYIDLDNEIPITCSNYGVTIIFTNDKNKLLAP